MASELGTRKADAQGQLGLPAFYRGIHLPASLPRRLLSDARIGTATSQCIVHNGQYSLWHAGRPASPRLALPELTLQTAELELETVIQRVGYESRL